MVGLQNQARFQNLLWACRTMQGCRAYGGPASPCKVAEPIVDLQNHARLQNLLWACRTMQGCRMYPLITYVFSKWRVSQCFSSIIPIWVTDVKRLINSFVNISFWYHGDIRSENYGLCEPPFVMLKEIFTPDLSPIKGFYCTVYLSPFKRTL